MAMREMEDFAVKKRLETLLSARISEIYGKIFKLFHYHRKAVTCWVIHSNQLSSPSPLVNEVSKTGTPALICLRSDLKLSRLKFVYGIRSILFSSTAFASRNSMGYFAGLSSPSVVLTTASLNVSPRSNWEGHIRFPTFSTNKKSRLIKVKQVQYL